MIEVLRLLRGEPLLFRLKDTAFAEKISHKSTADGASGNKWNAWGFINGGSRLFMQDIR
jgi:hypothetical protein